MGWRRGAGGEMGVRGKWLLLCLYIDSNVDLLSPGGFLESASVHRVSFQVARAKRANIFSLIGSIVKL